MKKTLLFICFIFLLAGCGIKGEDVNCKIDGKEAVFTLKDGLIVGYKLDGKKVSKSEIDEINGTYFTSSTDNEEAKDILDDYIEELGGSCDED